MIGAPLEGLPERLSLACEAEACLFSREGRSVWRMRRQADGRPFILKLSLERTEDLEEEFRLLNLLSRQMPGGGVGLIDSGFARQYKPEQDWDTRRPSPPPPAQSAGKGRGFRAGGPLSKRRLPPCGPG